MTWPGSAVPNHSQVTCVSVHALHLEVLEVAADSTQPRYRAATGHLAGPDAAFHLLQRENLRTIMARCRSGTELLFIIPNLEDILWNYVLPVVGLNAFTLLLTVSPTRAKWLLQLRSVLPTLQPPDLKSTSHVFFFFFLIVTAKHSRINCYKKGSLL